MSRTLTAVVLLLLLVASTASAGNTGYQSVATLRVKGNGILINLSGYHNADPVVQCGSSTLMIVNSTFNRELMYATLLGAMLGGKQVKLSFSSCTTTSKINVDDVTVAADL